MRFSVNFKSGKPVYLQLAEQVKSAAASGALRTGESLPSIRPLAEELRVNRNTVAKAYAELEAQGVIETHPGKGCFLRSAQSPLRKDARRKALAETLDESVIRAHHLLLSRSDFLRLAEERYDALANQRERAAAGENE
jgi:GntR family transcriptional regulator